MEGEEGSGYVWYRTEMLKAKGEVVIQWLSEFFNMVWKVGVEECSHCPIHKKGSRMECTNYRGISVMSIVVNS